MIYFWSGLILIKLYIKNANKQNKFFPHWPKCTATLPVILLDPTFISFLWTAQKIFGQNRFYPLSERFGKKARNSVIFFIVETTCWRERGRRECGGRTKSYKCKKARFYKKIKYSLSVIQSYFVPRIKISYAENITTVLYICTFNTIWQCYLKGLSHTIDFKNFDKSLQN